MWNDLTMRERADLIRQGVALGYKDIDSIRNNYHIFGKGSTLNSSYQDPNPYYNRLSDNDKKTWRNLAAQRQKFNQMMQQYSPQIYNDPQLRNTMEYIAFHENKWNNIGVSSQGARGHFQLMPDTIATARAQAGRNFDVRNPSDDFAMMQITALNSMKNIDRLLKDPEFRRKAQERNYDKYDLLMSSWLSGPGGMEKNIRNSKYNPKDAYGTSIGKYVGDTGGYVRFGNPMIVNTGPEGKVVTISTPEDVARQLAEEEQAQSQAYSQGAYQEEYPQEQADTPASDTFLKDQYERLVEQNAELSQADQEMKEKWNQMMENVQAEQERQNIVSMINTLGWQKAQPITPAQGQITNDERVYNNPVLAAQMYNRRNNRISNGSFGKYFFNGQEDNTPMILGYNPYSPVMAFGGPIHRYDLAGTVNTPYSNNNSTGQPGQWYTNTFNTPEWQQLTDQMREYRKSHPLYNLTTVNDRAQEELDTRRAWENWQPKPFLQVGDTVTDSATNNRETIREIRPNLQRINEETLDMSQPYTAPIAQDNTGTNYEFLQEQTLPDLPVYGKRPNIAAPMDKVALGTIALPLAVAAAPEIATGLGTEAMLMYHSMLDNPMLWAKAMQTTAAGMALGEGWNLASEHMTGMPWGEYVHQKTGIPTLVGDMLLNPGYYAGGIGTDAANRLMGLALDNAPKIGRQAVKLGRKAIEGAKRVKDIYTGKAQQDLSERLANFDDYVTTRFNTWGKEELQAQNDKESKFAQLRARMYNAGLVGNEFIPHKKWVKGKGGVGNTHNTDFSKMSVENRINFFKKAGASEEEAIRLAALYDTNKNAFVDEVERLIPTAEYNPTKAVKTGEVEVQDLESGNIRKFILDPKEITPNGGTKQVAHYAYNPGTNPTKVEAIPHPTVNSTVTEGTQINPVLPEDYVDAVDKNMKYATEKLLPGSKAFGSSTNIVKGNLYHGSHDTDVIMTEAQARKHPEFKNWKAHISSGKGTVDTYKWFHPNAGSEGLDINIINEKNGQAYGQRAHELYAQLFPKEYRKYMISQLKKLKRGEQITTDTLLDKTAQELLDAYDPAQKGIIDAFAAGKDKHAGRAYYYLNYGNVDDVTKGFESYMNYILGGEWKPTGIPISEFNDPIANAKLIDDLGLMGINKEQFVNDPKRMKLLVEYASYDKTFLGRGTEPDGQKRSSIWEGMLKWFENTTGGTANGVGLNSVLGGDSGYGRDVGAYATYVPNRMKQISGKTWAEWKANLAKNGIIEKSITPLTTEEIAKVEEIAKKTGVPVKGITTLSEALAQTENKTGKNYKNFINELAKEFDVAGIYGMHGWYTDPYVSMLEDQSENNIRQVFIGRTDHPRSVRERQNLAWNTFQQDRGNLESKKLNRIKELKENRETKYRGRIMRQLDETGMETYGLRDILERQGRKLRKQGDDLRSKIAQEKSDRGLMHREISAKYRQTVHDYMIRLNKIKDMMHTATKVGVIGTTVGLPIAGFTYKIHKDSEEWHDRYTWIYNNKEKLFKGLSEVDAFAMESFLSQNKHAFLRTQENGVKQIRSLLRSKAYQDYKKVLKQDGWLEGLKDEITLKYNMPEVEVIGNKPKTKDS